MVESRGPTSASSYAVVPVPFVEEKVLFPVG